MKFNDEFLFGVATASYQIEGAYNEDGRGESIWDRFSHTLGKTANGDTGDVAVDHYHRLDEDLDLIEELGITAYRFSISWPRLFPQGDDQRNEAGFAFYDKLIDGLLARGITPFPTLYHWDLPQALQDIGGWENREIAIRFSMYAKVFVEYFGDRLEMIGTLNEPWVFAWLGYGVGYHAPGLTSTRAAIRASHHTVLAHNLAYEAIKSVKPNLKVGIALNQSMPDVDDITDPEQLAAAQMFDENNNLFWMNALMRGSYPEQIAKYYGRHLEEVMHEDDLVAGRVDWIGINYYFNTRIGPRVPLDWPTGLRIGAEFLGYSVESNPEGLLTDMNWPVTPNGLSGLLLRWHREFGILLPPMYVTENGVANDVPLTDGAVHDLRRIEYLNDHLLECLGAVERGVDLRGYFQWSLLDNFEWAMGYDMRFGIVHVDYQTQVRTPKDSARFYSEVIRTKGVNLVSRDSKIA